MIYRSNNVYYLKNGINYEIANISIKYSTIKKKNVLVINGSGVYIYEIENPIEYSFKDLEKELLGD